MTTVNARRDALEQQGKRHFQGIQQEPKRYTDDAYLSISHFGTQVDAQSGDEERRGETHEHRLQSITDGLPVFKDPDGEAYVTLPVEEGVATHKIGSMYFRQWLTVQYFKMYSSAPSKKALESTIDLLQAQASVLGATEQVYLRVAWYNGALYLDLANERNEAVQVTAEGWQIVSDAPVRFRRSKGMLPLPTPVQGGSLDELRQLLNLEDGKDWELVVAWLLGTLQPTGTYPILALYGEKGSSKSTTTRYLRSIIDPSTALASSPPRDGDAVAVRALHNYVVAIDNMSNMPSWLSDALCRLVCGMSDSKRKNYSDTDEVILSSRRPAIINGIGEVAEAGDLLDRTISVTLPAIPSDKRKTEQELNEQFEAAHPRILGALLDVVAHAIKARASVRLEQSPRLADFAKWVTAAESALDWQAGHFMEVYQSNRESAVDQELEASPLAQAIINLMSEEARWTGTATQLLNQLNTTVDIDARRFTRDWPKTASKLSEALMRLAGSLRQRGIIFDRATGSGGKGRNITLRKESSTPKPRMTVHDWHLPTRAGNEESDEADEIPF